MTLHGADLILTGPAEAIAAWVYGRVEPDKLPELGIEGDSELADRFRTLFPLPAKAARPLTP